MVATKNRCYDKWLISTRNISNIAKVLLLEVSNFSEATAYIEPSKGFHNSLKTPCIHNTFLFIQNTQGGELKLQTKVNFQIFPHIKNHWYERSL